MEKLLPLERLAIKKIGDERNLKGQLLEAKHINNEVKKENLQLKIEKDKLKDLVLKCSVMGPRRKLRL